MPTKQAINVFDTVGTMTVATSDVATQDKYITLVLRNSKPFDVVLSATLEEALAKHEEMVLAAEMFAPLAGLMDDLEKRVTNRADMN